MKHTPGPWKFHKATNMIVGKIIICENIACTTPRGRVEWDEEHLANARLIARAPEMFDFIATVAMGNTEFDVLEAMAKDLIARCQS